MHLATDGHKIYVGDDRGVNAFDLANQSWEPTSFPAQPVTCIKSGDGQLFAGTKTDGLWQRDLSSGEWRRACPLDRLPDPHVESLALDGHDVYLGVGSKASGGLVKIDSAGELHIFDQPNAPSVAPTHIVIAKHRVLVCTAEAIYEWSDITEAWTQKEPEIPRPFWTQRLFAGSSAIWMSRHRRELARWGATDEENARFSAAWYIPANNTGHVMNFGKAGYQVYFFAQRDDEVWFGGEQWLPFVDSGLYRFNLKTGDFHRFSPADGFRALYRHSVYDGLWLDDRLWLATSEGLCVVSAVGSSSMPSDSRPAAAEPLASAPVPSKPVAEGPDGSGAAEATEAGSAELPIKVTLEDGVRDSLKIVLEDNYSRPLKTWDNVAPGEVRLRLPKLENGRHWLLITAKGHALRRLAFEVAPQGIQLTPDSVELYRPRFVVLRYSINTVGNRDLVGPDVKEGRVAIAMGAVPDLAGDWTIMQREDKPWFRFSRFNDDGGIGFAAAPDGASFDNLKLAPAPDQFFAQSVEATPGMLVFNHIMGNERDNDHYAKILVEGVTENPPEGVQRIDRPLPHTRFKERAVKPLEGPSRGTLALTVSLEGNATAPIDVKLLKHGGMTLKTWHAEGPGGIKAELPALENDRRYILTASAQGYAAQQTAAASHGAGGGSCRSAVQTLSVALRRAALRHQPHREAQSDGRRRLNRASRRRVWLAAGAWRLVGCAERGQGEPICISPRSARRFCPGDRGCTVRVARAGPRSGRLHSGRICVRKRNDPIHPRRGPSAGAGALREAAGGRHHRNPAQGRASH